MVLTAHASPLALALSLSTLAADEDLWVTFDPAHSGEPAPHIVFVTGDEEYRSEEGMPQLAKILTRHHGFRCSVLFAIDPDSGVIDPDVQDNIPGLHLLDDADLMVLFTRFRDLPDEQMRHIVEYVESGRPIVGLRTATHAFRMRKHKTYARYSSFSEEWPGGFGRQVLGETWVAHHGAHGSQSARGIVDKERRDHPILRGIEDGDVWDPADVYAVRLPMQDGITTLLFGEVVDGMDPDDPRAPAVVDPQTGETRDPNDPMMPMAWIRLRETESGGRARVFCTTMGSAQAFLREGSRRLIVNACYWALGLEDRIAPDSCVDLVGDYDPTPFGFGRARKGVRPADHRMPAER